MDNASTDGSVEDLHTRWPTVRLVQNAVNEGFARATNRGIRVSRGRYLLLINTDARLTPGALAAMVGWMEAHPRAGVVGPRLVFGDGRWQRTTAGRAPTLRAALLHHLCLDRIAGWRGLYLARDLREPFQPDWVSSACMLVRRAAIEQVGALDERLFTYMDDVDLCQRMREGGWEIWYLPVVTVVHYMSQSTSAEPGAASPAALRAFNAYFAARHGPAACLALRAAETLGSAARAAAYAAAALLRRNDPYLLGRARANWSFCRVSLEPIRPLAAAPEARAGQPLGRD